MLFYGDTGAVSLTAEVIGVTCFGTARAKLLG